MSKAIQIVITDSGLGGLSVAAQLYEKIKTNPFAINTQIIFVNALPETQQGYNKMGSQSQKIATFNQVLQGINRHFNPDMIGIACNTLSVLVEKTKTFEQSPIPIISIIPVAIESILRVNQKFNSHFIIVFGTETTIQSGTYEKELAAKGFNKEQIISIACPNLASEIEMDFQSGSTLQIVDFCIQQAIQQINDIFTRKVLVVLGCTHYSYIQSIFEHYLKKYGLKNFRIVDPNQALSQKLLKLTRTLSHQGEAKKSSVHISVYSRCPILPSEVESISTLLQKLSPTTVKALQQYKLREDLF